MARQSAGASSPVACKVCLETEPLLADIALEASDVFAIDVLAVKV